MLEFQSFYFGIYGKTVFSLIMNSINKKQMQIVTTNTRISQTPSSHIFYFQAPQAPSR
jgi:hypothetical protein